jgi:hypothetical protein
MGLLLVFVVVAHAWAQLQGFSLDGRIAAAAPLRLDYLTAFATLPGNTRFACGLGELFSRYFFSSSRYFFSSPLSNKVTP